MADEKNKKPVAVDVMGGDHGSEVIVRGAVQAANELQIPVVLVGRESEIKAELQKQVIKSKDLVTVVNADEVISMHDSPAKAIRSKHNTSIRVAYEKVRDNEASAVISPGNTGAMLAAGLFVSGTMEGITRPAIATLIPKSGDGHPTVLIDSGANVQCNAEQLVQFGIMGKFYSQSLFDIENPKIGILSNGTESSKGNDLTRAAAFILSQLEEINSVGFIEGRHIPSDDADVVVCDGFIGNIVLKTMEGSVELVVDSIRHYISNSLRGKIGMWFAKPIFKKLFQEKLDPSAYGGAPLLGLNSVAIVCHGSSNEKAIFNAVRVADQLAEWELVNKMRTALASVEEALDDVIYEDGMWGRMGNKFDKSSEDKKELKSNDEIEETR